MSTLKVTNIQDTAGGNSSTSEEIYNGRAKAWVNFNGTGATVTIRASFNVNSITDTGGSGNYTVNFSTAFSDNDYVVTGCYGTTPGSINFQSPTTTDVELELANSSGTFIDRSFVTVAIFR